MTIKFGSVCSGIEAASVAWEPLGMSPAWFSEIEPFPSSVLAHRFPSTPNLGDMTVIDADDPRVNQIDVMVGGTPCQAFSVAGLRRSLDDERGNLSLAFCRLARRITAHGRLRTVVWENVPGVLSTKDNAFGCFLAGLVGEVVPLVPSVGAGRRWSNAGCVYGPEGSAAWRVLDAQFVGLAQRRKRVFVVFCVGGWADPAQILFEWEGVRRDSPPSREPGQDVAGTIASRTTGGGGLGTDFNINGGLVPEVCGTLSDGAHMGGGLTDRTPTPVESYPRLFLCLNAGGMGCIDAETETPIPTRGGVFDVVTHALKAEGHDASEDGTGRGVPLVPCYTMQERMVAENHETGPGGKGWSDDGVAFMLEARHRPQMVAFRTAGDGAAYAEGDCSAPLTTATDPSANVVINDGRLRWGVRRMLPIECERLQGFPDGWTLVPHRGKEAADGPRYKAIGNSMATNVMRWIGRRIVAALESRPT